jgi:hypothetical protein
LLGEGWERWGVGRRRRSDGRNYHFGLTMIGDSKYGDNGRNGIGKGSTNWEGVLWVDKNFLGRLHWMYCMIYQRNWPETIQIICQRYFSRQ